jgi:spore maturation protein SpmB
LKTKKKAHSNLYRKAVVCLILFCGFFSIFSIPMGLGNALNTMMNTAYRILMDTVFYIMAIAVIAGAVSSLLTEFGVVALLNKLLSPLMKPLFGMPGASALGMVSTYLSDNPAILTLADDKKFRRFFKAYQIPALTNLGTSFGMGLIVTSFAVGMSSLLGKEVGIAAICGNIGAIFGAIVSTRLMLLFMKKHYGKDEPALKEDYVEAEEVQEHNHKGFLHVLDALMDGGKKGVDMGLAVIPGVLLICSIVLMLTNGKPAPQFKYAMIERVTSNGKYYRHSLSIEIPDSGDSLTEVLPNHGDAVWTSSTPDEDGKYPIFDTYTTKGRTFETNERLYVTVNKKAWYGRGSFRIVLLREGDASEDGIRLALEPVEDQSEGTTMLLTTTIPQQDYTGSAFEGIGLLPFLADKLSFLLKPLFGFSSGEAVAVPVTALGSAGAALGLIPGFAKRGLINVGDLAVFVAICMCWSGYLSTHVSMMEVLDCREHTGKALLSHTIGGLCAGVAAHWLFRLAILLLS